MRRPLKLVIIPAGKPAGSPSEPRLDVRSEDGLPGAATSGLLQLLNRVGAQSLEPMYTYAPRPSAGCHALNSSCSPLSRTVRSSCCAFAFARQRQGGGVSIE